MLKEFKKFALKGNVLDMAVGVIIGSAFGKIVTSLVNDIITPALGVLLGKINMKHLKLIIRPAEGEEIPELAILYGQFLQNIIDFLIISVSVFIFVKLITSIKAKAESIIKEEEKKEEEKKEEPPKISKEEELLTEIRDLLKQKQGDASLASREE